MTTKKEIDANARLAAIVDSSDDAIIGKNLEGIITDWNKSAERLFGYEASEAVGRHISIIAPTDRVGEMTNILEKISRGEKVDHFETQRRSKSGEIIDISLTVSPVYDTDGNIVGASKIARNISDRLDTTKQLVELTRELDHRAKNLLAVVLSMIRLTKANSMESYKKRIEERILSLSNTHARVAENNWRGASLPGLIHSEIDPFKICDSRFIIGGPLIDLNPTASQCFGIVLHELCTNAIKHGSLSQDNGKVNITWGYISGGDLEIIWEETCGPLIEKAPEKKSFGMRMIDNNIKSLVRGETLIEWRHEGLRCRLLIPSEYLVDK